ncbi:hypothetical protein EV401DRAFT_170412 [Pisolithus croceorrhizus]|nr:hypothetical protein EV401DRAFT_170412 [Pisolithus croceorrhizus]
MFPSLVSFFLHVVLRRISCVCCRLRAFRFFSLNPLPLTWFDVYSLCTYSPPASEYVRSKGHLSSEFPSTLS